MARNPLDRSAAFTVLLEQDRQGFGKMADPEATKTITKFLDDYRASGETNMWNYGERWLAEREGRAQGQAGLPEAGEKSRATVEAIRRGEVGPRRMPEGDFWRAKAREAEPEAGS